MKNNKNKVLIERLSNLYLNKRTPPLGCFVKYIPNISFEHQRHQHLKIKFLHEQYSNLYLENQTPLLRRLSKYIPNTFNEPSPRTVFRICI